jgi:DNA-binding MarR family transcriptional regulator
MADQSTNATKFLREGEIRRGVELLYFGYSHLTRSIDAGLAKQGLGRAHHRALYFMARQPGLTVSDLLKLLNITKQSLGRVVNDLVAQDLIALLPGVQDRRQRHMRLTDKGVALEAQLFAQLREMMSAAYGDAGADAVSGFWQILEGLVPEEERDRVFALQNR